MSVGLPMFSVIASGLWVIGAGVGLFTIYWRGYIPGGPDGRVLLSDRDSRWRQGVYWFNFLGALGALDVAWRHWPQ